MIYSDLQIQTPEGSNSMPPLKASLFIVYCLLSVVLVGTVFSHFWRTSRLLLKDQMRTVTQPASAPDTVASRPLEPNQSQS